jgi:hypothetical protein
MGRLMHTAAIILSVATDKAEEFERGFREHEYRVWEDLHSRGQMVRASLQRLEITSHDVNDSVQYMVVAVFPGHDHDAHDSHPGFRKWDERAEQYQVAQPLAFGGETLIQIGG